MIEGVGGLGLHHLYRAMTFLGEQIQDQRGATPFSPRCTKDRVEEEMFFGRRDLFTGLDMVFFDTTSLYFEGQGGVHLGQKGHSKDHRPDLNQMVIGVVIDSRGKPICCVMWPGNTTDVKSLIPVTDRIRSRFQVGQFCVVADRGMISAKTVLELEQREIPYILGARMRKVKEEVVEGKRYIVCLNPRQAIVESLQEKIQTNPKELIGNKGYRKYLKMDRETVSKELERSLDSAGHTLEWGDIKQDLKAMQEVVIEDQGKALSLRTQCVGTCGKVFQAVGVAIPPTIREL